MAHAVEGSALCCTFCLEGVWSVGTQPQPVLCNHTCHVTVAGLVE
jgi:hypothetical protein